MAREGMAEPLGIDEHLVSLLAPASYEAEQYRTLADAIELMHKDIGLHVLAVTSPTAGDGKTVTAINLAGTLARAPEAKVLLVCADLRKPSVMEYLGMAGTDAVGLVDAILDPAKILNQAVQHLQRFNLSVLLAGGGPADPYGGLNHTCWAKSSRTHVGSTTMSFWIPRRCSLSLTPGSL